MVVVARASSLDAEGGAFDDGPSCARAHAVRACVAEDEGRTRCFLHPGLPLVCYLADECQRFVTHDPIHGEAGFIEASHTFGTCCLLACPSLSSLENAFSARGATVEESRAAAALLWTSTATKLVFRTTDGPSIDRVAELAPRRPGLAPAVRVRPLSELGPGECVALTADGRFERRRLEPSPLVDALRCVWPVPAPVPQACGASPGPGGALSDLPALPAPSAPELAPAGMLLADVHEAGTDAVARRVERDEEQQGLGRSSADAPADGAGPGAPSDAENGPDSPGNDDCDGDDDIDFDTLKGF